MRAIMLMFDTLARDFLSNYGNDWINTPNFERLREKTVTFDNFYGGKDALYASKKRTSYRSLQFYASFVGSIRTV